jgi:hypothetical protein
MDLFSATVPSVARDTGALVTAPGSSVDESHWPLVIYTLRGPLTLAAYQPCLDHMERALSQGPKFQIFDARRLERPDFAVIHAQATWIAKRRDLIRRSTLASIFVKHSPVVSYALSAVFAISPIPVRIESVTTMEDAFAKVLSIANEKTLVLPTNLGAFLHLSMRPLEATP